MHALLDSTIQLLTNFINQIGYLGIFIGMFLESTLVPIPSELVMIPAGIAASQGTMNLYAILVVGTLGNIVGAVFMYHLAASIGRKILLKIGKYFFVKEATIQKIESFFQKHGPISVFIGRLLPGFRHFISIPAGIAKMNLKSFYIYTSAGSAIWTSVLVALGFFIGENQDLIAQNLNKIILVCALFCLAVLISYLVFAKKPVSNSR
ncbi:MAG: DedA family protein [Rickettsiales bacterium]|nr:DedA family protein [Rickettsiales bacterium]